MTEQQPGSSVTKVPGGAQLHGPLRLSPPGECSNVLIRATVKKLSGQNILLGLRGNAEAGSDADNCVTRLNGVIS